MSIVVKEEEVLTFAKRMRLRVKTQTHESIRVQVQWRVDRRCIIVAWKAFPKEVASLVMKYLGNEYEMETIENEER